MTLNTLVRCEPASLAALAIKKKLRWFGVAFGLLLGLAAVCHGCHTGDHDDELSLFGGKQRVNSSNEQPAKTIQGATTPTP